MTELEGASPAFGPAATIDSAVAYIGSLMTFLSKASETDGRFALMEFYPKSGNEPPPHIHDREHEIYFVRGGSMRFYCEDKTMENHSPHEAPEQPTLKHLWRRTHWQPRARSRIN